MWTTDTDDFGFVNAITNGEQRLHIVPGTVKNAESVPVVVALLNRAEAAEAKIRELEAEHRAHEPEWECPHGCPCSATVVMHGLECPECTAVQTALRGE